MNIHPSRVVAGVLLVASGFVVAVSALAIALAKILVDAGMTVRPADAALLGDLVSLLPFIVTFAGMNFVAAVGLLAAKPWAEAIAASTVAVAVTIGAIGLLLVIAGRDPLASGVAAKATADGIGILGAFTLHYLAVIAALGITRLPQRVSAAAVS